MHGTDAEALAASAHRLSTAWSLTAPQTPPVKAAGGRQAAMKKSAPANGGHSNQQHAEQETRVAPLAVHGALVVVYADDLIPGL